MADLIDRDTQPTHGSTMWMEVSRMNDFISRQAAIDALWKALYEYEDKTEKLYPQAGRYSNAARPYLVL